MDIYVGRKKITLNPKRDFVAQGGEGSVYVKGNTAYKIYSDPAKMLPVGKVQELAVLDYPGIVKPEEVISDANGQAIGYTMKSVPSAYPLCQTFTKSFRDRYQLGPAQVLELVQEMQQGVAHVHSHRLLVVDLNEMNFLVSTDFRSIFFLDVDSYQTPHYPATALMESVRDRHSSTFSEKTDWFSFAVVSFQMFIGIHPYKGKHATLKTLDERMQANVSVLNTNDVTIPAACQPLSILPRAYRAWYEAVLENGERLAPPSNPASVVLVAPVKPAVPVGVAFDIRIIGTFDGPILATWNDTVVTAQSVYVGGRRVRDTPALPRERVHIVSASGPTGAPLLAYREDGMVRLHPILGQKLVGAELYADAIASCDGRLYLKQGANLTELVLRETPAGILAQPRIVGNVLEQATQLFEGVVLQNLLGASYASLLPESGVCRQERLPELDGYQIVDARFEGGVLIAVGAKDGRYDKFIFRFDSDGYDVRVLPDVADAGVNFTTLATGLCLHLTDTDALEVFAAKRGAGASRTLVDPALTGECKLLRQGAQARFVRSDTLCAVSSRNT
jgi:hypothetical protein